MFAVVQAQQGRGGFGGFGGVTTLVKAKVVQEELKMTDEQITKVDEWAKEFGAKSREIMKDKGVEFGGGKGGGGKGGLSPEMQEKMAAATAEINKVAFKDLGEILKKEQIERLKQIDRQYLGVNAFTDAETAASLKLTDTQKTSIKGISEDLGKDRREIMTEAGFGGKGGGKGGFDPEKMAEVNKKVQKVQKEYVGKVVDLLNDEQKKTWTTLIGAPFDVSKIPLFGGPMKKKD
jgi:hypothetical protein